MERCRALHQAGLAVAEGIGQRCFSPVDLLRPLEGA
jgi:hypothetical protein